MQFDAPALKVEFSEGFEAVNFRVEEGGYNETALGSEAFGGKMDFHNADGEGFWDGGEFLFADACGRFDGLDPGLEALVGAELLAFCKEHLATFKCPRSIDFSEKLPRLDNGKLYKQGLREQYRAAAANK